jgi:cation diffusion facilitator family transporter
MLIGISMIVVSIKLFYDSFVSIINGSKLLFSWNLVIVSIITIITKMFLYLYTKNIYKKINNLLIKSNMIDHRNDMVLTSLTLIAIICAKYRIYFVDGIVGTIISLWICYSGCKLYRESYNVLMDQAIDTDSKKKILDILKSYSEIKRIGDIYSVPIGYKYIVVITIYVNGSMKTKTSHQIADKVEKAILNKIDKIENVIVHIEPYVDSK